MRQCHAAWWHMVFKGFHQLAPFFPQIIYWDLLWLRDERYSGKQNGVPLLGDLTYNLVGEIEYWQLNKGLIMGSNKYYNDKSKQRKWIVTVWGGWEGRHLWRGDASSETGGQCRIELYSYLTGVVLAEETAYANPETDGFSMLEEEKEDSEPEQS